MFMYNISTLLTYYPNPSTFKSIQAWVILFKMLATVLFHNELEAMARTEQQGKGHATRRLLTHMAHGGGTHEFLRVLGKHGLFRNKHGVHATMSGVNRHLQACRETGAGANKSDACDMIAIFTLWLEQATKCQGNLEQMRCHAATNSRLIYLELCVMGGQGDSAAACGHEAGMVLSHLCEDVGMPYDAKRGRAITTTRA